MFSFPNIKKFIITLFIVVLPGVLSVPTATAAFRYLHEGMKIPSFEGRDILTGKEISSETFLQENNTLIIVFWATWSKRSIEELKALKEIAIQFENKSMRIIAVNVDDTIITSTGMNRIIKLINDLDLPYPSIIDDKLEIFYKFGVIAVPSTAITDSTGIIRYGPAGYSLTTRDFIVDSIEVLLGLKDTSSIAIAKKGYTPKNKALRYYNLGLNLRHKRLYSRAISNLEVAIETDSTFPVPYSLLGEIYFLKNDYLESITQYKIATGLDSEFVAAWAGLGQSYLASKIEDSAEYSLKKALDLDENYLPAIINLCVLNYNRGEYDKASLFIEKALELNPKNPEIYYHLGEINRTKNNLEESIKAYKKGLELYFPQ